MEKAEREGQKRGNMRYLSSWTICREANIARELEDVAFFEQLPAKRQIMGAISSMVVLCGPTAVGEARQWHPSS